MANLKINNNADEFKVWIEIENTTDPEIGKQRAEMLTQMIRILLQHWKPEEDLDGACEFWWHDDRKYCASMGYNYSSHRCGGFSECSDNGEWFNLKYLATGEA